MFIEYIKIRLLLMLTSKSIIKSLNSLAASSLCTLNIFFALAHLNSLGPHEVFGSSPCSADSIFSGTVLDFVSDDYLCYVLKYFSNVETCLRGCLEEAQSVLISKGLSSFWFDHFIWPITFIGYEHFSHIRASMLINLFKPIRNVVESLFLSSIIHQNYTHCSFIICLCYCSKSFLPCSVPNL